MDPKRKKIYIGLIILCIAAAVGILWWGGILGGGSAEPAPTVLVSATPDGPGAAASTSPTGEKTYPAPAIFPSNSRFDTSVLDLSAFKAFKSYTPPKLEKTDVGREDPFKSY